MPLGGAQSVHLRLPRNPSPCSLITQVGDRGEGKLIADNLVELVYRIAGVYSCGVATNTLQYSFCSVIPDQDQNCEPGPSSCLSCELTTAHATKRSMPVDSCYVC